MKRKVGIPHPSTYIVMCLYNKAYRKNVNVSKIVNLQRSMFRKKHLYTDLGSMYLSSTQRTKSLLMIP